LRIHQERFILILLRRLRNTPGGFTVRNDIHPGYVEATVSCACGNVAQVHSTVEKMHVDVCSKCHPFYTGRRQQLVDRGGRIDQFNKRYNLNREVPAEAAEAAEAASQA
jgi:large subunit ribosomal protein L31